MSSNLAIADGRHAHSNVLWLWHWTQTKQKTRKHIDIGCARRVRPKIADILLVRTQDLPQCDGSHCAGQKKNSSPIFQNKLMLSWSRHISEIRFLETLAQRSHIENQMQLGLLNGAKRRHVQISASLSGNNYATDRQGFFNFWWHKSKVLPCTEVVGHKDMGQMGEKTRRK